MTPPGPPISFMSTSLVLPSLSQMVKRRSSAMLSSAPFGYLSRTGLYIPVRRINKIKGINNGQSLVSIVRRDEQDRKAKFQRTEPRLRGNREGREELL